MNRFWSLTFFEKWRFWIVNFCNNFREKNVNLWKMRIVNFWNIFRVKCVILVKNEIANFLVKNDLMKCDCEFCKKNPHFLVVNFMEKWYCEFCKIMWDFFQKLWTVNTVSRKCKIAAMTLKCHLLLLWQMSLCRIILATLAINQDFHARTILSC